MRAFAIEKQSDDRVFVGLSRAAEQRVFEFNEHVLANVAWSFATAQHLD